MSSPFSAKAITDLGRELLFTAIGKMHVGLMITPKFERRGCDNLLSGEIYHILQGGGEG
jgi:hypothetical protein